MSSALLQIAINLLLFAGQNLGIGWWLARRLPLGTGDRLWLALVTGICVSGGLVFAGYVTAAPLALNLLPTVVGLGLLIPAVRDVRKHPFTTEDRAMLRAVALTTVVVLAVLAWIRHYSGGGWAADWAEHLQRAQLFAEHGPSDTLFFNFYALPARPPLWNTYIAQIFAVTGPDFINNQLQVALAALLIVPPVWGLVARFGGGVRAGWIVTLLVALNPSFLQNATFTWTRAPTVALTLGGIWFFLQSRGDATGKASLRVAAFALLAAATIMHYSAGPWLVVLAVMHLWDRRRAWRAKGTWRELGGIVLAGTLIMGPWLWWSLATFGASGTTASTTTMMGAAQTGWWGQISIVGGNLVDTVVPWFMRLSWSTWESAPETWWGNLHDMSFILYQTNVWFTIGSVGAIALVIDLWRDRGQGSRDAGWWSALLIGAGVLGIAVTGTREAWGLAHICLQPLIYVALACIATRLGTWSPRWRFVFWCGFTVDVALGTLGHFAMEGMNLLPEVTELSRDAFRATYGVAAHANIYYKVKSLSLYLGDELTALRPLILVVFATAVVLIVRAIRQSSTLRPTSAP